MTSSAFAESRRCTRTCRSLDDQEALIRRYVSDHYNGPVSFHCLKAQERGEHLERVDLDEAVRRVENGLVDVVISEDLGRICRRNFVIGFCELCEDHNTRLITLNDNIDTARDDWNTHAVFSAFRHESYNKETAKRIRRGLRNRFSLGGIVQTTVFGYVKPEGAKSDDKLHKDPNAEPIYDEMFRRLEDGASFAEVSDWLNSLGIPPGRYCRGDRWDPTMVGRLVRNPILKGFRVRNQKMSKRVNKTGRRRSVNAPPESALERVCPHLAFIDPERFDRVNARAGGAQRQVQAFPQGRDRLAQGRAEEEDTLARTARGLRHLRPAVPVRRPWPSRSPDVPGAYEYSCWNAISFDGPLAWIPTAPFRAKDFAAERPVFRGSFAS